MAVEIAAPRAERVTLRIIRDEPFRFLVKVIEADPEAEQPTDPNLPRITRPKNLTGYTVLMVVKATTSAVEPLKVWGRGDGLVVDDAAGTILVDLADEDTAVLGMDPVDPEVEVWSYGVVRMSVEGPSEGDKFSPIKGQVWIES